MPSPPPELHIDVLIFGGGIAGLWTLARLRKEGYSCLLLESTALGAGQTIASQGIIHGGIKYALTGHASAASKAIAEMPAIWRACLKGEGEVDLRAVKVLSERQYLWTTPGIGSRIAGFAASKVIRTSVHPVPQAERPPALLHAPRGVDVYSVDEVVLDPRSLVRTLAQAVDVPPLLVQDYLRFGGDFIERTPDGLRVRIESRPHEPVVLRPRRLVCAAGAGNAELCGDLKLIDSMAGAKFHHQRRPLHMVMARGELPPVCGHCVGTSDKPRVTITSQTDTAGRTVWYIGGEIAETGVGRTRPEQIAAAKKEVSACLPWIDLGRTEWSTLEVTRAEGVFGEATNQRPDEPTVLAVEDFLFVYPTKLAFAPLLASRVIEQLKDLRPTNSELSILTKAERPPFAQLPWEGEHVQWT